MNSTNSQSRTEMNIKDVISHLETQVHLLSMYDELLQPSIDILDMQLIKNELQTIIDVYILELLDYDEVLHCCQQLASKLDGKLSYFNINYSVEDFI